MSFQKQWSLLGIAIMVTSPLAAFAQSTQNNSDAQARAEYEQKKNNITYASDYVEKNNTKQQQLLQVSPKHDDSLSVKTK
ncbi:hypothetical protein [Vibrio tritonius]|uniref:hypothetical protein n=1 Tax=Vibrio tritonius TaxID=1435069 RepID=UPI00315DCBB4